MNAVLNYCDQMGFCEFVASTLMAFGVLFILKSVFR